MSPEEQQDLLDALMLGGSPQMACRRLEIPVESFSRTLIEDADFRQRLEMVRALMTQNVVATLYAAALKGTASAQALWLKTFPPPAEMTVTEQSGEVRDDLETLSDEELEQWLALQTGTAGERV